MAGHADTASELVDDPNAVNDQNDPAPPENGEVDAEPAKAALPAGRRSMQSIVAVAIAISVVLAVLVGWLGVGAYQDHARRLEQERFVAVGRQAAVNLTTIDFTQADADVARILDSGTGTFLDDFRKRAQPFIDVVKQAKSKSVGVVTDAGLETRDGDHAQILVAVQVTSSTEGGPDTGPRGWRMRIDVQKTGSDFKVANVQFVI